MNLFRLFFLAIPDVRGCVRPESRMRITRRLLLSGRCHPETVGQTGRVSGREEAGQTGPVAADETGPGLRRKAQQTVGHVLYLLDRRIAGDSRSAPFDQPQASERVLFEESGFVWWFCQAI